MEIIVSVFKNLVVLESDCLIQIAILSFGMYVTLGASFKFSSGTSWGHSERVWSKNLDEIRRYWALLGMVVAVVYLKDGQVASVQSQSDEK